MTMRPTDHAIWRNRFIQAVDACARESFSARRDADVRDLFIFMSDEINAIFDETMREDLLARRVSALIQGVSVQFTITHPHLSIEIRKFVADQLASALRELSRTFTEWVIDRCEQTVEKDHDEISPVIHLSEYRNRKK